MRWFALMLVALLALVPIASAQQPALPNTSVITFQSATTSAGNGSVIQLQNTQVLGVQVIKTSDYTGLVSFEGSLNNSTWAAVYCYPAGSSTGSTTAANTTAGIYRCNTQGIMFFRARASSVTAGSGALTVLGFATSLGPLPVDVP